MKLRKRFLLCMLAAVTALTWLFALPEKAQAASAGDLTFVLDESQGGYVMHGCNTSAVGELVIPETYNGKSVVAIGWRSLQNCTGLTGITLPDSVISIGAQAFHADLNLYMVTYCRTPSQWNAAQKGALKDSLLKVTVQYHNYENDICSICHYEKQAILGDVDGNQDVTQEDAVYLLLHTMFGEDYYPLNGAPGDMDGNGTVDQDDAVYLLLYTMFGGEYYPLVTPPADNKPKPGVNGSPIA